MPKRVHVVSVLIYFVLSAGRSHDAVSQSRTAVRDSAVTMVKKWLAAEAKGLESSPDLDIYGCEDGAGGSDRLEPASSAVLAQVGRRGDTITVNVVYSVVGDVYLGRIAHFEPRARSDTNRFKVARDSVGKLRIQCSISGPIHWGRGAIDAKRPAFDAASRAAWTRVWASRPRSD